eukprot:CAMPEP_0176047276 /NCGR_PEP_ID=MMETSP0120_2-20121206/23479_1 /TAXON_ID=160619 /ORGANISM="Kryptoperidinium foliaceum, Strain CCMP 1326" /LENGTH=827 /DNA_ID=CAMNT_0017380691 /DNA_START=109 /DNA_END=2592 /DNA_ORIENTATION=+
MEDVEVKHDESKPAEGTAPAPEKELSDGGSNSDDDLKKGLVGKPKDDMTFDEAVSHHEQFNMREIVVPLPGGGQMRFNPFSSLFAIAILWGLSIWCMVDPDNSSETIIAWKARVTELFTWFYVGTNPCFMAFMIWVAFRFGHVRLGPKDSRPEFDDLTYFAMLFSAGIGVGLFFYGVSEPLWHQGSNWFTNAGYHNQDEVDMNAINYTVFHWGITGWSQYLVVALCAGLAGFRFNLPFTLRSCFYPLLGEYTWGWIGDVIDGFTIVTTVAGVCTSLGLGAFQLKAGLEFVGAVEEDLTPEKTQTVHVVSIWVITCVATMSVVSGLNVGIKYLSQLGFGLGMLLLLIVFVLEKTNYMLNLIVQEVGYYFQTSILLLNFWTDTFGQLKDGQGRAVDDKSSAVWWMDAWTVFYIGWWVAWAAFVGLFIARISKGRTIGSIVFYSYLAPLGYTIIWFCIFGGTGIRQARQAMELEEIGETYFNSTEYYLADGSTYCYDVPQENVVVDGNVVFENTLLGVTPVCKFNSAEADFAWFNVLNSFSYPLDFSSGFGPFLSWLSLFTLAIYFVTSSDSGSLIVDNLASNGFEETHWIQRIFWAFTEGSVATALLVAGGSQALRALQSASILSGLPFTAMLAMMCISIYRMCIRAEKNDEEDKETSLQEDYKQYKIFTVPIYGGVFNIFEYIISLGSPHPVRKEFMACPSAKDIVDFLVATVVPFVPLYNLYSRFSPKDSDRTGNMFGAAFYGAMHFLWIALFASMAKSPGLRGFAWCVWLFNGCILSVLRMNFRARFNIDGNMFADYMYSVFLWPQVIVQMAAEMDANMEKEEVDV